MKIKLSHRVNTRQKLTRKKILMATSVAMVITAISVLFQHLKNPVPALASSCESSYTLDWGDPTTYTVTCGSVNSSNWSVKGNTCFYYSPVFNVGGNPGDPDKVADISVRINQSGNLDGNDTAWVYIYSNGIIAETYRRVGDSASAVFTVNISAPVSAGGTYQIVVKAQNDKSNELWQIKNGEVTSCLRALSPLPISLANFTAKTDAQNKVNLKWTTYTEKDNEYFTIEYSTTGISFVELKKLEGAGNSTSTLNYFYTHENPSNGINYYRLRQTDYNGQSTLSHVIKTSALNEQKKGKHINVYPNPFIDEFTVEYFSNSESEVTIRLATMGGKVVSASTYRVDKGINTMLFKPELKISKGSYIVQVVNENEIATAKIICN